jgi:hypothetical protein
VGSLIVGTAVAGWSLRAYWALGCEGKCCPSIVGVCVPFFLLLLICLEAVGMLAATILSTARQTEHAAQWLPHGAVILGGTVVLVVMVSVLYP